MKFIEILRLWSFPVALSLEISSLNFDSEQESKHLVENVAGQPTFSRPPRNVTVIEGQEVTMTCSVTALHEYKMAWVHEDSQSIISIGRQLYTHSKRLSLAADHRTAAITISPVLAMDRGWYMCQINTDPMTSSHSYLQVLVPPTLKEWSGPEIEAREGSTVKLVCLARAHPPAHVTWRRTDAQPIFKKQHEGRNIWVVEGSELEFSVVSREHSATYTCHVDNKETPALSRDTQLIVTYPPMVWLHEELVGVKQNFDVTISCTTDANPPPRHSWLKNGSSVVSGPKHRITEEIHDKAWKISLTIRNAQPNDYVRYSCIANNPIGQAVGTILLYEIKEQLLVASPRKQNESGVGLEKEAATSTTTTTRSPRTGSEGSQRGREVTGNQNIQNKSNYFIEVTLVEEIANDATMASQSTRYQHLRHLFLFFVLNKTAFFSVL